MRTIFLLAPLVAIAMASGLPALAQTDVPAAGSGTAVQEPVQPAQAAPPPQVPAEPSTPSATSPADAAPPAADTIAPPPTELVTPPAGDAQEPVDIDAGAEDEFSEITPLLPHDLSPWGMFMGADIVVKAVMIGLAFASLVTWTIALAKGLELMAAKARASRSATTIVSARTLADAEHALRGRGGAAGLLVEAARQEVALSEPALSHVDASGLKERVASRLSRIEAQAGRSMTRGTGLLATIGSTAPFVGLFGTVWGIMNSFIGISEAQTTNLAVVAPGIAEALLATAIGLVAAIPAVIIYNVFARSITGYRQILADASAGVERLVSRDLDFRAVRPRGIAAAAE